MPSVGTRSFRFTSLQRISCGLVWITSPVYVFISFNSRVRQFILNVFGIWTPLTRNVSSTLSPTDLAIFMLSCRHFRVCQVILNSARFEVLSLAVLKIEVFLVGTPCRLLNSEKNVSKHRSTAFELKPEGGSTSLFEISATVYQTTRHNNSEDLNLRASVSK